MGLNPPLLHIAFLLRNEFSFIFLVQHRSKQYNILALFFPSLSLSLALALSRSVKILATMKESKESTELQSWTRGLHRVLCMQGGDDDRSYAKNSEAPASAIALSKPLLIEAISSMKLFHKESSIRIADLGCATGHNTLSTVGLLVQSLRQRYREECGSDSVPEFEVFFSDLPSNDFNSLFRSLLSSFDVASRPYYFAGVPGSFYDRLFPNGKLHLAVSLSALHWLSQVSTQDQLFPLPF